MKYLALLILIFISGCVNLSKQNHMMISEGEAEYSDSFCGYASAEWGQFGGENKALFTKNDIEISFCSNSYYSKNIAAGFIIPIVPIDGRELHAKRWVRVSNLNEKYDLSIESSLQFCQSRYPYENCGLESSGQKERILLNQGESGWIALPDIDKHELKVICNETAYTFTLIKNVAYSWWMITV